MMLRAVLVLVGLAITTAASAASSRFVIDDDEYADKVIRSSERLLKAGKLLSAEVLRAQVHTKGCAIQPSAVLTEKLEPPELCERLRESTFTVGSFYQCPDCDEWHFSSSAGFVVAPGGVLSTCCHVVLGEDPGVKKSYLIAADSTGRVFPVRSVLAADVESDTCFVQIDAPKLKPLPLRTAARTGERVYCLSHPGGYYFMFTQGMVARLTRKRNEMLDAHGQTNGVLSRPILFLNVTTEFAPGSSGAPVVDEAGNVVAQVASITDACEPAAEGEENLPPAPSVPVRFCTAAEEILRLADPKLEDRPEGRSSKPEKKPKPESRKLRLPAGVR